MSATFDPAKACPESVPYAHVGCYAAKQDNFKLPPPPPKVYSALDYATDPALAKAYVASRREDALTMTSVGILVLPYAKVRAGAGGAVWVNEVLCTNADCAVAYILARWW